jgi:hypothetical protein
MCIIERESIYDQYGQGSLALLSCLLLLKVLYIVVLNLIEQRNV